VKDEMIQMSTAKKHNVRKCQIRGKVKDPVEYWINFYTLKRS